MKPHEYVSKYGDTLYKELRHKDTATLKKIAEEFVMDVKTIAESRNAKTQKELDIVIKEQNEKWNTFARLFNRKYGGNLIMQNMVRFTFQGAGM